MSKRVLNRSKDVVDAVARTGKLVARKQRASKQRDLFAADIGTKAEMPKNVEPCKPTLVDKAPCGPEWLHEIKFDGYRLMAFVAAGKARLDTKSGLNWTDRFPGIADALTALPVKSAIIDGEAVVETEDGIPDFGALQAALGGRAGTRAAHEVILYAFDLLYLDGADLRREPLEVRRQALAGLLADTPQHPNLRLSEHLEGDGGVIWERACKMGWRALSRSGGTRPTAQNATTAGARRSASAARGS